jgi:Protein of unknown function (DUF1549)/Protein of unknown function (DUF1553)
MRTYTKKFAKYVFAAVIVLFTFGYLLAGLSKSSNRSTSNAPARLASAGSTAGTTSGQKRQSNSVTDLQSTLENASRKHQEYLAKLELSSAPKADWLTQCRRLSLALVGTGVSLEEIRTLESLPEQDRAGTHLENLFEDSRFHWFWAERWTRMLVGNDEGQFISFRRRRFRNWVSEGLAANRPYDVWVRQMITSSGLWTDKPEVNFITATFDSNDSQPDPVRLAARTSRVFLGLRIDCLQCHNDFLGNVSLGEEGHRREGLQSDFHSLAAFYTAAESTGLQGVRNREVKYKYKYLDATEETDVKESVPYGSEWLPKEGNARERLASWTTDPRNRQFARSAVSHVWTLMFGRCYGDSMDNIPLDQELHPVMEVFVDDFIEHKYDMRRLIRLIASSDPFTVDSRADFEITARHEEAGAAFPLVRLRGEQVAGAILQASRVKTLDRDSSLFLQLFAAAQGNEFVQRYGDRGEEELDTDIGTMTQRLIMMNGQLSKEAMQENPVLNATSHLNMFSSDEREIVSNAYLSVLNRQPTTSELDHFASKLEKSDDRGKQVEDLMWVLVNSSEFAWNH